MTQVRFIASAAAFLGCVLLAAPSYASYWAVTAGSDNVTQPNAQLLTGVLYNQWDPTEVGFAYNLLQEQTTVSYTVPAALAPGPLVTVTPQYSYTVVVPSPNAPKDNLTVNVNASAAITFPSGVLVNNVNQNTDQIAGDTVPPIPLANGPNAGIVSQTQASKPPPVNIGPVAAPISASLGAGPDDGPTCDGGPCTLLIQFLAYDFNEAYSLDGGPWTQLEDFANNNAPLAAGTTVFGTADTLNLNPGDTIEIRDTLNVELKTQYVPEPGGLAVLGSALTAFGLFFRRRLHARKSEGAGQA